MVLVGFYDPHYYLYVCGIPQFDLPFVEYYRVKEFELLPEATGDGQRLLSETHINSALSVDSAAASDWRSADPDPEAAAPAAAAASRGDRPLDSVWNCDGEVVSDPAVNLR